MYSLQILSIFQEKFYHNQNLVNKDSQPSSSLFYIYLGKGYILGQQVYVGRKCIIVMSTAL